MNQYNFDEHPHIQHCMRRIAMNLPLEDSDKIKLLESLSDVLNENSYLREREEVCECGAYVT